ncbi:sentrin-specific protease 1 isoform X2 [Anabrus simplex]|uniref:sentrin-specific protease 1 isoform X2 n=1 Tax=Anabrus simplex TaxID=316456 RepID=UPI0034DCE932
MFSAIRKFWYEWFGRHKGEDKQPEQISANKRPWSLDDDDLSSFPKRRRLLSPDVFIGPRFSSDDFLCPARDFGTNNRMASNSLFCSMTAVHCGPSQLNREGKASSRTRATKENIILISDDEEDKGDRRKKNGQKDEKQNSLATTCKEKEVKAWFSPKLFTKREQFHNQNKPPPRGNEMDPDVQIVKMVEQKNEEVSPREFRPYRRVAVMERRRENSLQSRAYSTPLKSRSSPHIPSSTEKTLVSRKLSVNESFRLEEKRKYSELLEKYTHVPMSSVSSVEPLCSNEKRKNAFLRNSRSSHSRLVEYIDLTKGKDRISSGDSSPSEIEVLHDKGECSLATKMEEDKSEDVNDVIKKTKGHPLYDPCWTTDLLDRRRKEEQEKLKIQLSSQRSREILQDFLEERIQTHMRITEVALPEEIITLEDEELKLPKLTTQMERMVNAAFQRGNSAETLVECFNLRITRRDIATLSSNNWLNDEVINFYMNLLIERGKEGKYPTMYGFNTFFYPKLIQSGHSSLKRWTRKIDIFSYDMLIIPVHLGVHWCMAAVDFRKKSIRYYDSMGAPNRTCLEALMGYLEEEMMDKKKEKFDRTGWTTENVQNIPQQMNGSDCGMFACMYAEFLCRDVKINFSQADMPYFRRKMAYEILTKKLLL